MDSEALRTFLTIRDCGGFSRAAERLHRSQPAISRRIALLEEEIGAPLFERAADGVVLSQAGQALAPHAERVLAALGDCTAALAALRAGAAGPLALALVGTLADAPLTPVLQRFARAHPGVALSLRTATSAEVSALVRSGEASIGLRYHGDEARDLDCRLVGAERLIVVAAPTHPHAKRGVACLAALAREPWLAFPARRGEAVSETLTALFLTRGVGEFSWTAVDSLTAQKRLVEAGFGLALMPQSAAAEELAAGTLAQISVRDLDASNPIFLVTRRGGYLSPAAATLIEQLTRAFGAQRKRRA